MKEQLNIADIIDMLIKRWWIWVLTAIITGVAVFTYTQIFVDPLYRTDGTLYVNAQRTQTSNISQGDMNASQTLVATYKEILKRRTFLSKVAADLDGRYSVDAIRNMLSMAAINDTEILEIKVTGKVPEDVYEICHSVLTHASDELVRVINAGSVKILDDGQVPNIPVSPNIKRNTLIAVIFGFILGCCIIMLLELFDTRIKSREDIIDRYDEPLLGEIPEVISIRKAGGMQ